MKFRERFGLACAMLAFSASVGASSPKEALRIGFITDMSGVYSDLDGPNGLEAIRMAIADAGGEVLGRRVEVIHADHQSKADIASMKAREMLDEAGISLLLGGTNTAANLAMNKIASGKKRPFISIGGTSPRLSGEDCTPYTVAYLFDTAALAKSTGAAVTNNVGKSWFFLTADYTFGHSLEAETAAVVKANGGEVKGSVRHPLQSSDFSSFLLSAQASKARVLGLANAGPDLVNAIKGAHEFGLSKSMGMAALLMFINDVHSLGLETTQGLMMTDAWYWDLNPRTREFAKRFLDKTGVFPNSLQAAEYSAVLSYLKAVKQAGTAEPDAVMSALKSMEIDDMFGRGRIRADGRYVHDMFLFQAKTPAESSKPWDYLKVIATIPGEQAFTTLEESKCPLVRQ
jgi:branched-chain amino acid transport system substrate-binding protein